MERRKSVIRSIRMKSEIEQALEEEAEVKDLSVNALFNQILTKYVEWDRHMEKFGFIYVSKAFFRIVIEELSEETSARIGVKVGEKLPREFIMFWWKKMTSETFFLYMEALSKYTGMFQCEREEFDGTCVMTFHHDLERKWSLYLSEYIRAAIHTCLNVKADVEWTEHMVVARFKA